MKALRDLRTILGSADESWRTDLERGNQLAAELNARALEAAAKEAQKKEQKKPAPAAPPAPAPAAPPAPPPAALPMPEKGSGLVPIVAAAALLGGVGLLVWKAVRS